MSMKSIPAHERTLHDVTPHKQAEFATDGSPSLQAATGNKKELSELRRAETFKLNTRFPRAEPDRAEDLPKAQFQRIKTIVINEEKDRRRAKSQLSQQQDNKKDEIDDVEAIESNNEELTNQLQTGLIETNRTHSSIESETCLEDEAEIRV
mmetsp:Transcript_287/g.440  ORF Transcript_287/g.440 Transcript_287/m.440 type:complete len:151 (+) Transcript_287:411-863(+)|eukprot:CAMPEP_0185569940 /NCGR_PEP_ID=MMETSP0434-20130131/2420_1 /TAXON_ID=626734 ORGANISM="Favella taraikaensis, Strain Fe Narragansett Bay" /NCGR_SAMPLE_ID=MMETSP0434 /ASSEMBLY_ACC=CAM_ASM_000379 /LENGTH=150 /DNA_ID=CAMNT_0028184915 /DNA_START=393 /DNA_END=845 /DNA_ORIENTATION=-